jgi:CheY-like chemotaxis protein
VSRSTARRHELDEIGTALLVIGVSGRNEAGGEQAARAAGMNFFFTKPVSPGKLAQALGSLPAFDGKSKSGN